MSERKTFECFGLVIHGLDWDAVRTRLENAHDAQTWIVTANPEILLEAKRDPSYWQTLRQADLRLVDGTGLQFVGWLSGASPKRLRGADLADQLVRQAAEKGKIVAFVGGAPGVADKAAWVMRQRYPSLRVVAEQGGHVDKNGAGDASDEETLHRLTLAAPELLLVAFGHPKQEEWIKRHLAELPSVKIAVGVGGTLDFWAGTAKPAPNALRAVGLEWLWRLIREPRRWKRIINAVVMFPWEFAKDKIFSSKLSS
jgi:N-acetylglucosaminyldiphosphoundecaprenol N-acetyl-beta-D-mannosaminyltransferase